MLVLLMTCKSMRCNTHRVNVLRCRDRVPSTAGSAAALVTLSGHPCAKQRCSRTRQRGAHVNDTAIREGVIAESGYAISGPPGAARLPAAAGRTGKHCR
jgi:aspartate ammonia-lyase